METVPFWAPYLSALVLPIVPGDVPIKVDVQLKCINKAKYVVRF